MLLFIVATCFDKESAKEVLRDVLTYAQPLDDGRVTVRFAFLGLTPDIHASTPEHDTTLAILLKAIPLILQLCSSGIYRYPLLSCFQGAFQPRLGLTFFGGPGINEVHFDEFQAISNTYRLFPAYFASIPGTFPLIGLTWFTQNLVATCVSVLSPAESSMHFSAASDHSQGLVMTVTIPYSKNDASVVTNEPKALK
ncbi:hypothetical protein BJV78DRAFT_1282126 [Lactifluus subvellereus]|nr:hypothetical protein BJV78DRAFT_1282126 [Lactifluus subvellereus]